MRAGVGRRTGVGRLEFPDRVRLFLRQHELRRTWRRLDVRTRWRILYAVNHRRAVADARHAWSAAYLAARNRRQARLIGVMMALWGLLQTVNTVVHVIRHDWLLTALGVMQLLILGVALLLLPWSPSRVARAEVLNRELAESSREPS